MAGPLDKRLNPSTRANPRTSIIPTTAAAITTSTPTGNYQIGNYDFLLAARINRSATDVIHLNFVVIWI